MQSGRGGAIGWTLFTWENKSPNEDVIKNDKRLFDKEEGVGRKIFV